nr:LRR receptor-like serine/threonine-protein kinase FLS2 [Quercus suber]
MGWSLVKYLLWALLLIVQIHEHGACLEEERMGLLELKTFLKSNVNHTNHLFPSWVNDVRSECCGWERVTCNDITGHVIELSLSSIINQSYYNRWLLKVSLLQPFKKLRNLDLSANGILGWLKNEEPNCLSKLSKLTHLNLRENKFDKEILRSLGALPVLKSLDLSYNNMWPLSSQELVYLSNLEVLILQQSCLNGSLPFKDMANFSSLKVLDLSKNHFTGSIPPYIGALSSLKALSLSFANLRGTIATQDLCALTKLEELDLGGNNFEGSIPPCLTNLTSLQLLDISNNRFSGNMSFSPVANLTSLEYIDLSYNRFDGLFSFNLFANHSKLKVIQFLSDNNKLDIETKNLSWHPLFQLKVLVMSHCNINKPIGNIPKFLYDQHELEVVAITHSRLNGSFPIWLLENNTRLQVLNLRSNSFTGQFQLPAYQYIDLRWLDVSDNHLHGELQKNIGKMIPKLEYLNLYQNHFEGDLPYSIGDMSNLYRMDLSFNDFSGEIPVELIANCTYLKFLRLSNNNFHGEIFSKSFNQSLFLLELNNNNFTGTLPVVPLHVGMVLNIRNNYMFGRIPAWMVNDNSSKIVDLSNNFFEGQIPCGLGSFDVINLSHNLLTGFLPSCLNLRDVRHILLRGNKLTGSLPKVVFNSSSLLTEDIRDNSFSGSIPEGISELSNSRVLLLSGNHFSGMIHKQMCQLKKLGIMDLSKNFLNGTIPFCLHNITFGKLNDIDFVYTNDSFIEGFGFSLPYKSIISRDIDIKGTYLDIHEQVGIQIVKKYRSDLYKGLILDLMSALDLSLNKLIGEIPAEIGQLSSIHALNLSYNQLTGSIPKTFSKLTQLERLDLSHNSLSGEIPSELIDLNSLSTFNVAHNNISGKLPDFKAQFATFRKSCYEGNPFLCSPPLEKSCAEIVESTPSPQNSSKV